MNAGCKACGCDLLWGHENACVGFGGFEADCITAGEYTAEPEGLH